MFVLKTCIINTINLKYPCKIYTNIFLQFGIAVAWLTLFDVVLLILLIPVMDRIIYPWIREKRWNFTMVLRIMIGLAYAVAAIFVAGLVEHIRLNKYWDYDPGVNVTNRSCCYAMVPQQIRKYLFCIYRYKMIIWQWMVMYSCKTAWQIET